MGSLPHHRNTPSALSTTPSSKVAQLIGRAPPSPAPTNSFEEDSPISGRPRIEDIMREVDRASPGEPIDRTPSRKSSRSNISRQRSKKNAMFYADAFAFREAGVPVPSIAPVLVELKTNVIVSVLKRPEFWLFCGVAAWPCQYPLYSFWFISPSEEIVAVWE